MTTTTWRINRTFFQLRSQYRTALVNLAMITAGCWVYVYGMQAVMIPAKLFSGGLTGLSILISYYLPATDVGVTYLLLNLPLLVWGWMSMGRNFIAYSLFGIVTFSLFCSWFQPPPLVLDDPLLAAVAAGVICGAGCGMILKSAGSAGGLDILAVWLKKRFGVRVGSTFFCANTFVLLLGFWYTDTKSVFYSVILLFICSMVMNKILAGLQTWTAVTIISDRAMDISRLIFSRTGRGVTFLNGRGGYSQQPKQVILTIAAGKDLPKLRTLVLECDPQAFVIVSQTQEILHQGRNSLPVF